MLKSVEKDSYKELILEIISLIPKCSESPQSVHDIAALAAQKTGMSTDTSLCSANSTMVFLELFGVLDEYDSAYKIKSQIPEYFIKSICWFMAENQHIFSNWDRAGVAREVSASDLSDKAPYFLKSLEISRLRLAELHNIDAGHSRHQAASVMLIKAVRAGKMYFLHQWDEKAQHFQLIGGKVRLNELHSEAARRELQEEISQHNLIEQRDYEMSPLGNPQVPVKCLEVSRTYGALTEYEFWLYAVRFKLKKLKLSHYDRWISIDEMRKGVTKDSKGIFNSDLYRVFEVAIPGGFEGIPISIDSIDIGKSFWDFIEIKPSLFGFINIDLKGVFSIFKR